MSRVLITNLFQDPWNLIGAITICRHSLFRNIISLTFDLEDKCKEIKIIFRNENKKKIKIA